MTLGTWRVDPVENRKLQLKKKENGGGGVDPQKLRGSRSQEMEIHKALYGQGSGLPADYGGRDGTEAKAFEEAAKHNKETKGRTDLDMDLDKVYSKSEILSKKEKANEPTIPDKFSDVRYPYSAITNTMDFMKFSLYKYVRGGGTVTSRNEESLLKKDRLGAVFLPIPSQLVDSNTTDYGQGSLNFIQEAGIEGGSALIGGDTEGAKKAINSLVAGVTGNKDLVSNYAATQAVNSLLGGSLPFSEVMARSSANVLNPNMELLFKGPTLRNFNFQFKFTPRFQKEAETVRTIIKIFKRNMAPRTQNAQLLKTPNIFEIQYIGKARDYLNRMKLCALRNVTMNYTGEGNFATYNDGSPISMIMTLSFTELTPIYNEDYAAYDNTSDGVGY
tara:strand:+ start:551 stop:1714 length:1164 start_codon:yes stop_codon:yes gene_type:complete